MQLDADHCYEAILSRDARFDGRFFTAVRTTGIYCRPVCPARTPKRQNVTFYTTAAAAEGEGFRPCLRCRPETSAGTPAWQGTSTTVARALRLIDETAGELDIDALASRLGMTDRHLRRLFDEHLGTSPIAVMQTKRAHLARRLLTETSLPMMDVAFGAGFSSLRRFNDAIRKAYACTPGELRRKSGAFEGTTIELSLQYRRPMRIESVFGFLAKRAIPGVETITGTAWRRAARVGAWTGVVEISADGDVLTLSAPSAAARDIHHLVDRARRALDLAADPETIATHLAKDVRLRPLVKKFRGVRVPVAWDPFETAIRAVAGQQVSVAAATTIMGRIAATVGEEVEPGFRMFPTPAQLRDAAITGMPASRAKTINALAAAVEDDPSLLARAATLEESVSRLCAIRGIGPWTAQYIAMRVIGEPDAFLHSDLGLIKAAEAIGIDRNDLTESAERWRPWRSYAAMILWESLS